MCRAFEITEDFMRRLCVMFFISSILCSTTIGALTYNGSSKMPVQPDKAMYITYDYEGSGTVSLQLFSSAMEPLATITESVDKKFTFTPNAHAISTTGTFYFSLTDGTDTTAVFPLYVDAAQAVTLKAPSGTLQTTSPLLQWEAQAGVPFYHVLVSDKKITMVKNEDGSISWRGLSVIWQAITPTTEITYGTPDPSGIFDFLPAPELLPGKIYNWIVLKNFSGDPSTTSFMMGSINECIVSGSASMLSIIYPSLSDGEEEVLIPASSLNYSVRWVAKSDVTRYRVAIYQVKKEHTLYDIDYDSRFLVWQAYTGSEVVMLNLPEILSGMNYELEVTGFAPTATYISERVPFKYGQSLGIVRIWARDEAGNSIPHAQVDITSKKGNSILYPLFLTENGGERIDLAFGTYTVTVSHPDYGFDTQEIIVADGTAIAHTVVLRKKEYTVRGSVQSTRYDSPATPFPVSGMPVTIESGVKRYTVFSDDTGAYSCRVAEGEQTIRVSAKGYKPYAATISVDTDAVHDILLEQVYTTVTGRITTGIQGISGVRVLLTREGYSHTALTDSTGTFSLLVEQGVYAVRCIQEGYIPITAELTVGEDDSFLQIDPIILQPINSVIPVKIYDNDTLIRAASVTVHDGSDGSHYTLLNDVTGFAGIPAAYDHSLTVLTEYGSRTSSQQLQVHEGYKYQVISISLRDTRTVRGVIVSNDGTPIEGVQVSIGMNSTLSDAAGVFQLQADSSSTLMRCAKDGFVSKALYNPGDDIRIVLEEGTVTVSGVLRSDATRRVLRGCEVIFSNGSIKYAGTTDINGAFTVTVPQGRYSVALGLFGHGVSLPSLYITESRDIGTLFALREYVLISGRVTDNYESPINNALLTFRSEEHTFVTYTAEKRVYELETTPNYTVMLKKGVAYTCTVERAGYITRSVPFVFTKDATADLIKLVTGQDLLFSVRDSEENAIEGVTVTCTKDGKSVSLMTDIAGMVKFNLEPGIYDINAQKKGYKTKTTSLDVTYTNATEEITLIPAEEEIAVFVGTADGEAIEDACVTVLQTGEYLYTDATGACMFTDIDAGTYTLQITKQGYARHQMTIIVHDGVFNSYTVRLALCTSALTVVFSAVEPVDEILLTIAGHRTIVSTVDSTGITITGELEGAIRATCIKEGYHFEPPIEEFTLAADEIKTITFTVTPDTQQAEFTVQEKKLLTSDPTVIIEGVTVTLNGYSGTITGTTDAEGKLTLGPLAPGTYTLVAEKLGYSTHRAECDIKADGTNTVTTIDLIPMFGTLALTSNMTEYHLAMVKNERVYIDADITELTRKDVLPAGTYTLTAFKEGYPEIKKTVTIALTQEKKETITFKKPSRVTIVPRLTASHGGERIANTDFLLVQAQVYDENGYTMKDTPTITFSPEYAGHYDEERKLYLPALDYVGPVECTFELKDYNAKVTLTRQIWATLFTGRAAELRTSEEMRLVVADDAVSTTQRFTVEKRSNNYDITDLKGYTPEGYVYKSQPVLTFSGDASISRGGYRGYVFGWNSTALMWSRLQAAYTDGALTTPLTMFDALLFAQQSRPTGLYALKLAPNPWSPYVSPLVLSFTGDTVSNTTLVLTVKLFTIQGEHVRTLMQSRMIEKGYQELDLGRMTDLKNGRYMVEIIADDGRTKERYVKLLVVLK